MRGGTLLKAYIHCAESTSVEDQIKDTVSDIQDDFDFVLAGIDKLVRLGDFDSAEFLLEKLSSGIQNTLADIAGKLESND